MAKPFGKYFSGTYGESVNLEKALRKATRMSAFIKGNLPGKAISLTIVFFKSKKQIFEISFSISGDGNSVGVSESYIPSEF